MPATLPPPAKSQSYQAEADPWDVVKKGLVTLRAGLNDLEGMRLSSGQTELLANVRSYITNTNDSLRKHEFFIALPDLDGLRRNADRLRGVLDKSVQHTGVSKRMAELKALSEACAKAPKGGPVVGGEYVPVGSIKWHMQQP